MMNAARLAPVPVPLLTAPVIRPCECLSLRSPVPCPDRHIIRPCRARNPDSPKLRRSPSRPPVAPPWAARERRASAPPPGSIPVPGIDMSLEDAEAFLATLKPEPVAEAPRRKSDAGSSGGLAPIPADARHRDRAGAVGADRDRPAGIPRQDLGAAPAAAAGEVRGRRAAPHRLRVRAEGRPAARRSPSWWRASTRRSATRCCSASPARARPTRWPR